jgi:hypothetical protein
MVVISNCVVIRKFRLMNACARIQTLALITFGAGYAVREVWGDVKRGNFAKAAPGC